MTKEHRSEKLWKVSLAILPIGAKKELKLLHFFVTTATYIYNLILPYKIIK